MHEHLHYIMATGSARGGMALVDGPQGVGKTELLHEFARLATSEQSESTAERKVGWLNVPTTDLDATARSTRRGLELGDEARKRYRARLENASTRRCWR